MDIKGYQIIKQISQGPISTAYLGKQISLDRFVLIKRLNPQWLNEADLLERFRREALICARLKHPNIVDIIDVETRPDNLYLVIEYIDGLNLEQLIRRHHPVPFFLIAYITREMLKGLSYAHTQGVIHRDIKPANVMVGRNGRVKIADFGLARSDNLSKISAHGEVVGTPAYMSPEQARVSDLDPRSDLFSLAITCYELAGQPSPFRGNSIVESIEKLLKISPPPLCELRDDIPDWYSEMIAQMLAKKAADRPASAAEILALTEFENLTARQNELAELIQQDLPVKKTKPTMSASSETPPPAKPNNALLRAPLLGLLLLFALIAVSLAAFLNWKKPNSTSQTTQSLQPKASHQNVADSVKTGILHPDSADRSLQTLAKKESEQPQLASKQIDTATGTISENFQSGKEKSTLALGKEKIDRKPDMTANISEQPIPVNAPAQAETLPTARLFVKCTPWANIYIDGKMVDTTPLSEALTIPAGFHTLALKNPEMPALQIFRRELQLSANTIDTLIVNLNSQNTGIGYLDLHVSPWAKVFVNGEYREDTPLQKPLVLSPGKYEIRLENPGYQTWRDSIKIVAREVLTRRIALKK